jgi:tetratricopeptide (TPR) repeat protein
MTAFKTLLCAVCLFGQLSLGFASSAQLHNTAGLAYYYQGKYAQAFKEFLSALKRDPNSLVAHYNLGRLFEKQGKPKDAFVQYQRSLSLDPTHDGARRGYQRLIRFRQRVELRVQSPEEVLEEKIKKGDLRSEAARTDLLQKRLRQIQTLISKREYDLARQIVDASLEAFPKSGELYFHLARLYFVQDRTVRSLQELSKALTYGLEAEDMVYYLMALSHERLGDYGRAEQSLRRAIELAPSSSLYYERLGKVLERQGKDKTALDEYKEGVRIDPSALESQVRLKKLSRELALKTYYNGRLAFEKRDYPSAHRLLSKAIDYGQLLEDDLQEAKTLVKIANYWVRKSRRIKKVKESQRVRTQAIDLSQDVELEDILEAPHVYSGRYIAWEGTVVHIDEKRDHYEVLVDTEAKNDFQEDVEMNSMVLLWVYGERPSDQRLSYLGTVEFEGKYKERRFLKNPFNHHHSVRRMPVIYVTDAKFRNQAFGQGFVRVFPEVDYRQTD